MLIEASNDTSLKNQNIISVNLGAINIVQDGVPFQEFPLYKVYYPDSVINVLIRIRNLYREQLNLFFPEYRDRINNSIILRRSCIDIVNLMPSFFDSVSSFTTHKFQEVIMGMVLQFEDPFIMNKTGVFDLRLVPARSIGIHGLEVYKSKFTLNDKEHFHFSLKGEENCYNNLSMIREERSRVVYSCIDRIYLNDSDEIERSLGYRFFTPCVKTKNIGAYGGVVRSEIVLDSN